jgi:hypothetical protein
MNNLTQDRILWSITALFAVFASLKATPAAAALHGTRRLARSTPTK